MPLSCQCHLIEYQEEDLLFVHAFNLMKILHRDAQCRFVINSRAKQPRPSDWIGLFRVGWSSVVDTVCSRAVPTTGGGVLGKGDAVYSVTFNGLFSKRY